MSPFALVAESRIQECIDGGGHSGLQGSGHPLDMDAYFAAPSSLRAGFGMLKNAAVLPPEVEALRIAAFLRQRLASVTNTDERAALRRELQARETEIAIGLERMKRAIKADAAN